MRWFPALVSNHVVDLVHRYADAELPQALTDYIESRDHYDYADHGRTGAEHAEFVTDEVVDRFCVLGTLRAVRRQAARTRSAGDDAVQHLFDAGRPRTRRDRRGVRTTGAARVPVSSGTETRMTTVRAAVIQAHANMPKDEAIDKHVELIAKAAADGAEVTCLQEIFHGPYFCAEQDPSGTRRRSRTTAPRSRRCASSRSSTAWS